MALLKPRALIAYCVASMRATSRLGARRRASGSEVAAERRMSSPVITKTEAAASWTDAGRPVTEVTGMRPRSSRPRSPRSALGAGPGSDAPAQPAARSGAASAASQRAWRDVFIRRLSCFFSGLIGFSRCRARPAGPGFRDGLQEHLRGHRLHEMAVEAGLAGQAAVARLAPAADR